MKWETCCLSCGSAHVWNILSTTNVKNGLKPQLFSPHPIGILPQWFPPPLLFWFLCFLLFLQVDLIFFSAGPHSLHLMDCERHRGLWLELAVWRCEPMPRLAALLPPSMLLLPRSPHHHKHHQGQQQQEGNRYGDHSPQPRRSKLCWEQWE